MLIGGASLTGSQSSSAPTKVNIAGDEGDSKKRITPLGTVEGSVELISVHWQKRA